MDRTGLSLSLFWAAALAAAQPVYRLDDQLRSAAVTAHPQGTVARLADPIAWDFDGQNIAWTSLRGAMGFRKGELIVKGEGSSPVILSPKETQIDWSRYESVDIRAAADAGSEIKIRIGEAEYKQKLGPPKQYQVYKFTLNIDEPIFGRPLAVMPTDSLSSMVAIDFIELVPKRVAFPDSTGLRRIAKRDDWRNTVYVHTPSTLTYKAPLGRLHFSFGVVEMGKPVTFRVLAGAREVFSKSHDDPDTWVEAEEDETLCVWGHGDRDHPADAHTLATYYA